MQFNKIRIITYSSCVHKIILSLFVSVSCYLFALVIFHFVPFPRALPISVILILFLIFVLIFFLISSFIFQQKTYAGHVNIMIISLGMHCFYFCKCHPLQMLFIFTFSNRLSCFSLLLLDKKIVRGLPWRSKDAQDDYISFCC